MTRLRNISADHPMVVAGQRFEPGAILSLDLATLPKWSPVWRGLRCGYVVDLDVAEAEPVPVREYEVHEPVAEDVPRFARGRRKSKG